MFQIADSWFAAEPVFMVAAIIGVTGYAISIVLMFMGSDGTDAFTSDASEMGEIIAAEGHAADHPSSEAAFKIFSVQSVLAFLMGFGCFGLVMRVSWGAPSLMVYPVAFVLGGLAMFLSAFLAAQIRKLDHVVKRDLYPNLGQVGKVYTQIPAAEKGVGQVQITAGGQLRTINAVSKGAAIKSFKEVEVVGVKDQSTIIVREK